MNNPKLKLWTPTGVGVQSFSFALQRGLESKALALHFKLLYHDEKIVYDKQNSKKQFEKFNRCLCFFISQ
ncbi:hypothetical protein BGP_1705 [Beggiatoa sp. PS]|nr:hypothetical protein BGP_1705 [Beggiatoa sp. PS]